MEPTFATLDVPVHKIDVDEHPALASRYGVRAIPTLIAFRNGLPVAQRVGNLPREKIVSMLG